ncbi:RDD family protein [Prosthecobacter sp.]|uniref:RDD family protein n=1 Tax=Prosthecobacter sp. TaxID=1965333 RepID=UPI001D42A4B4|nr:RDD family protein [Prosthecobacter sp.]MCB1278504.1 RDD family protein [Prosthecobacter sp.]
MSQYHIARDSQQLGVFSEQDVQSGLASGSILASDLLWAEGMADWQPVSSKFGAPAFAPPAAVAQPAGFNPYAAPIANVAVPTTGQGITLASLGQRLGAVMLDGLIQVVVLLPLIIPAGMMDNKSGGEPSMGMIISMAVGGIGLLALLIYNLVLLGTRGQTLGKKIVGTRIAIFPGGEKPGFAKAFLVRSFVVGIIGAIPLLGPLFSLVDICCIFRADHRCIHDMMAGTHVIEGQPPEA